MFFENLDGNERADVVMMLNIAYATEVKAYQQYRAHAIAAIGPHALSLAEMLNEHAEDEQKHSDMLRERIENLGGMLRNRFSTMLDYNALISPEAPDIQLAEGNEKMAKIDLSGEVDAINLYEEIAMKVRDSDPATHQMICSILMDEYHHDNELRTFLGIKQM